jgi:uncharacterized protein YraI
MTRGWGVLWRAVVLVSLVLALILLAGCASGQALVAETPIVAATPTSIGRPAVSFDGISFQYDPSLAAYVSQEILPATARGGMFGTPSPAHTLFTFVGGPFPAPAYPDALWQWHNSAEIFVYPSSGFGSQDGMDVTANERMHALGQLLAEQPSAFDSEFPALPPYNAAQDIHAQIHYLGFQNGRGVRFLTQHNQEARPINNQELVYVFQGITEDGLHGVTAYFPVNHPSLPDGPQMSDADYQALMENLDTRLAEATRTLNESRANSFSPSLALLDDVIQSLQILPTETDFVVRETEAKHVEAQTDTPISAGPGEAYSEVATLPAFDTVLVTGESQDGDWLRVLCPDLSTGNCWLSAQADLNQYAFPEMEVNVPVTTTDVAMVQLLVDSDIYNGPDVSYPVVGQLRSGEKSTVYSLNADMTWWLIECPAGIAQNCWVPADPAITQPIAFSVGDGWQDITGNYVSYRVPPGWQPVVEEPGEGSVLDQWRLGIPGVEYDQIVAFFAVPFDQLQPADLISTNAFTIGGQPGAKWVRGGGRTISYDYYTSGVGGAGSFGIHVTLPNADPELESCLDGVAASVMFHRGDEAAIEQAMLAALTAQGAPTENARIDVQKVADGYARVAVYYDVIVRPDIWDLGFAYYENGNWTSWAFGSGIAQEHMKAAGIPRSVWPDAWLQPDEDSLSPGANLPPGPRLVVQRPDNSIQYVSLDGNSAILVTEAPASLRPSGFGDISMTDGPQIYVRQWWGGLYVLDTPVGQLIPLDFVPSRGSPVAVRPISEEAVPEGQTVSADWDISLAWSDFSAGYTVTAGLFLSTQDGSRRLEVLKETYGSSDPWTHFVPWRWRWRECQDDQLFFTKEPGDGMGGFLPFVGAANLWVYDLQRGDSMELISDAVTGGKLCLDAISPDDQLLAHHCDGVQITLMDLETGQTTAISLPEQMTGGAHLGSVRFSPDGSRIAFAVMTGGYGLVGETQGYIAVSDGLSGGSDIIATSEPGEWFSVAEWLWGDTLVLQSHNAGPYGWPAVWTVKADGNDLIKVADGTYLAAY